MLPADIRIGVTATSFEVNIVPGLEPPYALALKARNISAQEPVEILALVGLRAIFVFRRGVTREHIPNEYVTEERHCGNQKGPQDDGRQYFNRLPGQSEPASDALGLPPPTLLCPEGATQQMTNDLYLLTILKKLDPNFNSAAERTPAGNSWPLINTAASARWFPGHRSTPSRFQRLLHIWEVGGRVSPATRPMFTVSRLLPPVSCHL